MVAGYAGERLVRQRLRPSGWDAVESPLVVAAIGLAGAMAALGGRADRGLPGGKVSSTAACRISPSETVRPWSCSPA